MTKIKLTEEDLKWYHSPCADGFRNANYSICFGKSFDINEVQCYFCSRNNKCYVLMFESKEQYDFNFQVKIRRYERELRKRDFTSHIQFIVTILTCHYYDNWTYQEIADYTMSFFKKYYKVDSLRVTRGVVSQIVQQFPDIKKLRKYKKRKKLNPLNGLSNAQETSLRKQIKELKKEGRL